MKKIIMGICLLSLLLVIGCMSENVPTARSWLHIDGFKCNYDNEEQMEMCFQAGYYYMMFNSLDNLTLTEIKTFLEDRDVDIDLEFWG